MREFGAERIVPGPVCGPEALDGMLDYLRSVRHVAEDGYAAGIPPIEAARKADLGEFVKLDERECLVANLHRAYSELRAEPSGGTAAAGRHLRRNDRVQRRPHPLLRLATGREPMKLSTDRILTTHTGSLPRPEDLVQLTYAQEEGKPVDHDVMAAAQARAVEQVVEGRPAAILFEAANPRHGHEWEDLGKLKIPDDKVLIPGVVDVKTNVLEHPRLVAQRIGRFADIAGRERVIAGTDCGFGTFVDFGAINDTVAWLKLGALAQGARLASERLWR